LLLYVYNHGAYLGYDSFYKRDKTEEIASKPKVKQTPVSLGEPLSLWIGLLILATLIELVVIPFAKIYGHTGLNVYLAAVAGGLLYIPGIFILPLVISLWVGDRVSNSGVGKLNVMVKGFVNAIYCAIVYVIAIFIIYIIMTMQNSGTLATLNMMTFIEYLIAIPVLILIVIMPLFALISLTRHEV
jgi:hypothetical protein